MRVGPIAIRDGRKIEPWKSAVGLVQNVDADFFLHHVALVAQILIIHFQRAHAIGFKPQNRDPARSTTQTRSNSSHRSASIRSALSPDRVIENLMCTIFPAFAEKPLKHHVLKQMRETAAAARLDAKSDVVVDADRGHRRRAVRRNNHAQAVRQRYAFDGNVQLCQEAPC